MTVVPMRPTKPPPLREKQLKRRVFARLDSRGWDNPTIEKIANHYVGAWIIGGELVSRTEPPPEIAQLMPVLRGKGAIETLTTLLLQGDRLGRIKAPSGGPLTAADLKPIVADWLVKDEARRRDQEERYGAYRHAQKPLSKTQLKKIEKAFDREDPLSEIHLNRFEKRIGANMERIWGVLYEHGAIRQQIIEAAPQTVRHMRDRVERQLVAMLGRETSLDLAMIQGIGLCLSDRIEKSPLTSEPHPPEPQPPAKLRGDKEAEAAVLHWVKSVDYERAVWGTKSTKTGQVIGFPPQR
ncbi:MAG: hypothetical protein JO266_19695 [Acidobacteria bacterium]|nr:hypothetical protein [Acidobacteriota bacterium]